MKKFFVILFACISCNFSKKSNSEDAFVIKQYDVVVKVNKDASLDITEKIDVHFTEQRHGIFRMIPYKYKIQELPPGEIKAEGRMESNGYITTDVQDIKVEDENFEVSTEGYYKKIKIGTADKYVNGDHLYVISYKTKNSINFFKDYSELYFNCIGDQWPVEIEKVNFKIELYDSIPGDQPKYFIATGNTGSQENNTTSSWSDNRILNGNTTQKLSAQQGLTVGIVFPKDFLINTSN